MSTPAPTMKAAVLHGSNDIRYEDCEQPQLRSGCVKIHVRACGICGSDIPRVLGNAAHFFPIVLGHEFAGEICAIADDVNDFAIGDHVACAPLIPCFQCPDCAIGNYSLCKHYTFIGSRIFGGMAEYVVIPASNAVKINSERSFTEAALLEPATVALHGIQRNDYIGGGTTAIIGAGTIGLFTAQWAQIFGAASVVFLDVDDERLALAKDITGCDGVNLRTTDQEQIVRKMTDGRGFDYVFCTTGASAGYPGCFAIAANHAHICFIGTPTGPLSFTAAQWELLNRRELIVTGSWMSFSAPFPGSAWTLCAQYLSDGRLKCDPRMIHRVFPLAQCREAFDCYRNPAQVKGRIMLVNPE